MPQSVNKYMVDGEMFLRAEGLTAITATALSGAKPLNRGSGREGHANAVAEGQFTVIVDVESIDTGDGNETYTFELTVADDVALGTNAVVVASKTTLVAGQVVFVIDSEEIDRAAAGFTPAFIGINAVLAGTTPSLGYAAWISTLAND